MYIRRKVFSVIKDENTGEERYFSTVDVQKEFSSRARRAATQGNKIIGQIKTAFGKEADKVGLDKLKEAANIAKNDPAALKELRGLSKKTNDVISRKGELFDGYKEGVRNTKTFLKGGKGAERVAKKANLNAEDVTKLKNEGQHILDHGVGRDVKEKMTMYKMVKKGQL